MFFLVPAAIDTRKFAVDLFISSSLIILFFLYNFESIRSSCFIEEAFYRAANRCMNGRGSKSSKVVEMNKHRCFFREDLHTKTQFNEEW